MKVLLGAFLMVFSTIGNAQSFEGIIEMEMIYESLPAEMQAYKSMLPTKTITIIKGKKARIEKPGAMGMETVIIMDREAEMSYILIDAMGSKMFLKQAIDDGNDDENENVDVAYFNDVKTIAGYKCKRAEVTDDQGTVVVWYTTEITSDASAEFSVLKGFPLEYAIEAEGMEITVRAVSVDKEKVSDDMFIVPADYEEVTEEDLGGMMNGGF